MTRGVVGRDRVPALAYRYEDADGRRRLTYKLRLAPVLRNSKWVIDEWVNQVVKEDELSDLILYRFHKLHKIAPLL